MSSYYSSELRPRRFPDHPKLFDLVSQDGQIVGDAKFYALVRGRSAPPAKWSTISEHVLFLQNTPAQQKFLVFGNDRRVPIGWLDRWRNLLHGQVNFYFIGEDEIVENLIIEQNSKA